jgi:hypothetical protein
MIKVCKSCGVEKPLTEFYKQSDCSDGYRSNCKICKNEKRKEHYQANKEQYKILNHVWRENNDRTEYHAKYRKENKEKIKQYFVNSRHLSAKNRSIRRARLLQRTPNWLNKTDLFEIECIYKYCGALRSVGLKYEVDHIIPLAGKKVSGFHVPSNLQVIPMVDNRQKANK